MQVDTDLSRADIVRLHWYLFRRGSCNVVFAIALVYFFYQGFAHSSSNDIAHLAPAFAVAVVGAIAMSLLFWSLSVASSLLRSSSLGSRSYALSVKGLRVASPVTDSLLMWGGISSIAVSGTLIVFKVNKHCFHLVPRRSFSSAEEFQGFYKHACALKQAQPGAQADEPASGGPAA